MMRKKALFRVVVYAVLFAVLVFCLGPLLLLVVNAFKTKGDFLTNPFGLPAKWVFNNIPHAWERGGYAKAFINSVFIGFVTLAVVNVLAGTCAYALAKLRLKYAGAILGYFMFVMAIPLGLFLVPLFFLWQKLHLINTLAGLIITYCGIYLPFWVIFLRAFFVGIPSELLESARMDGCGELQTFFRIVVPISKPAFSTTSLLVFLNTWNEFFFANAFITTNDLRTVATRYIVFTGQFSADWTMICAAGLISVIPIMAVYLLFQRTFIEGFVAGSLKG